MSSEPINPTRPQAEIPADRRLAGRRILITGGGSGIGLAAARIFAIKGAKVSVLDLNVDASAEFTAVTGGLSLAADISNENSVAEAATRAADAMGGIDGVVASAGISGHERIENIGCDNWSRMLRVNLDGMFHTCRAALPYLRQSPGATIVTVSSSVALVPTSPGTAYAASKGGVLGFTKTLALECAPNVRVNAVCPGMTDTPMNHAGKFRANDGAWPDWVKTRYLMQRVATAEEVAYATLFLTSYESSYITGTTITVDGGRTYY